MARGGTRLDEAAAVLTADGGRSSLVGPLDGPDVAPVVVPTIDVREPLHRDTYSVRVGQGAAVAKYTTGVLFIPALWSVRIRLLYFQAAFGTDFFKIRSGGTDEFVSFSPNQIPQALSGRVAPPAKTRAMAYQSTPDLFAGNWAAIWHASVLYREPCQVTGPAQWLFQMTTTNRVCEAHIVFDEIPAA